MVPEDVRCIMSARAGGDVDNCLTSPLPSLVRRSEGPAPSSRFGKVVGTGATRQPINYDISLLAQGTHLL